MPSGLLSPLIGPLGPLYVRKKKDGSLVIVPRARSDKKSADQMEYRRRLATISKVGSKMYLQMLKRFETLYSRDIGVIASLLDLNIDLLFEYPSWPFFRLFPKNIIVREIVYIDTGPDSSNAKVWINTHLMPGLLANDHYYFALIKSPGYEVFMFDFVYNGVPMSYYLTGLTWPGWWNAALCGYCVRSAGGGLVQVPFQHMSSANFGF
jgi:hypothetical protein